MSTPIPVSNLTLKTFQQFVNEQAETYVSYLSQAIPNITPNFISGAPELAFFQEMALEFFFLQSQLNIVALMSRLSTSGIGPGLSGSSSDVDTFVGDFGLTRLPATYDKGQETFSTATPNTKNVTIPVGTVVQDPTGQIQYQVIADTTNPNYNSILNGYVLTAGQLSVNVTIQALTAGTSSNVAANQLVVLANAIPGIQSVTNSLPINNAVNAESDAALKARFVLYIASLSRATSAALDFAIESVPGVVRWVKLENTDPTGATHYGFFTVYVDDGTGSPPASLITAVSNAVNAYRGFTIQYAVEPPTITNITIAATVVHNPNTSLTNAQIASNIQSALVKFINGLGFGATVYFSQLYDIIWDAVQHPVGSESSMDILKISSITLNGGSSDVVLPASNVPIASNSSVTITVT